MDGGHLDDLSRVRWIGCSEATGCGRHRRRVWIVLPVPPAARSLVSDPAAALGHGLRVGPPVRHGCGFQRRVLWIVLPAPPASGAPCLILLLLSATISALGLLSAAVAASSGASTRTSTSASSGLCSRCPLASGATRRTMIALLLLLWAMAFTGHAATGALRSA